MTFEAINGAFIIMYIIPLVIDYLLYLNKGKRNSGENLLYLFFAITAIVVFSLYEIGISVPSPSHMVEKLVKMII